MVSYLRWLWVLLVFAWLAGAAGCASFCPIWWMPCQERAVQAALADKSDLELLVIAKDMSDRSRYGLELRRKALSRLRARSVGKPKRPEAAREAIVKGLVDDLSIRRELDRGRDLFNPLHELFWTLGTYDDHAYMIVPALAKLWHRQGREFHPYLIADYMNALSELANSDTLEALSIFEAQLPDGPADGPALIGLGKMGASARRAVPMIESMLTHSKLHIRGWAAEALWRITGEVEPGLRVSIELVDIYGRGLSRWGLSTIPFNTLGAMGADGRPAVPILLKLVVAEDGYCPAKFKVGPEYCQRQAALALWRIEPSMRPMLVEFFSSNQLDFGVLSTFRDLGAEACDVLPALQAAHDRAKKADSGANEEWTNELTVTIHVLTGRRFPGLDRDITADGIRPPCAEGSGRQQPSGRN